MCHVMLSRRTGAPGQAIWRRWVTCWCSTPRRRVRPQRLPRSPTCPAVCALTSTSWPSQGEPVDLVTPLKAYIDAKYAGGYAADAAEDLSVIQALRAEVVANSLVSPDARRDLLVRCAHPASPSTGMQLCHTGWSRCSGDTHGVWLPSPVVGTPAPLPGTTARSSSSRRASPSAKPRMRSTSCPSPGASTAAQLLLQIFFFFPLGLCLD
jgi:hypothetical protein